MTGETWAIMGSIATLLVLYTKVIFDYATIKATLNGNTAILIKIETLLNGHDEDIKDLYERVAIMETKHSEHHGGQ